jgi:endonuclease YncB( thermonuclease family)
VGVADGDTVTVLDSESQQHKIRLVGIDAPEKAMPYGQRSKQALSDLVYGNEVEVEIRNRDRYGREVGRILIHGKDANLAQIEAGMAWVYRQYLKELSPREANTYITAENTVRAIGRGLWGAPNPTPPWEWRKSKH